MLENRKLILIILSAILAVAILALIILSLVDFKFSNIGGGKAEEKTVSILNSYSSIEVEEIAGDVTI